MVKVQNREKTTRFFKYNEFICDAEPCGLFSELHKKMRSLNEEGIRKIIEEQCFVYKEYLPKKYIIIKEDYGESSDKKHN